MSWRERVFLRDGISAVTYSNPASTLRGALKYIATALGRTKHVRINASVSTRLDHSIDFPLIVSFDETDSSGDRTVKL